jgi:hypothetical protein
MIFLKTVSGSLRHVMRLPWWLRGEALTPDKLFSYLSCAFGFAPCNKSWLFGLY